MTILDFAPFFYSRICDHFFRVWVKHPEFRRDESPTWWVMMTDCYLMTQCSHADREFIRQVFGANAGTIQKALESRPEGLEAGLNRLHALETGLAIQLRIIFPREDNKQ